MFVAHSPSLLQALLFAPRIRRSPSGSGVSTGKVSTWPSTTNASEPLIEAST